ELYQAATPDAQAALRQLALVPTITTELAQLVLGDAADTTIEEGVRLGFLTSRAPGASDVHPLLRTFLDSKLKEDPSGAASGVVTTLVRYLIQREQWDDAFVLVHRFFTADLFTELLEVALPSLLRDGRTPTLARWLERAAEQRIDVPIIALAEAEVAFRD